MMTLEQEAPVSSFESAFVGLRGDKSRESKTSLPRRGATRWACHMTGPLLGGDITIRRVSDSGLKSGWACPDLPVAPASAESHSQTTATPSAPPAAPLRVWDLALLWCFALILWCFLPEPLPTNDAPGGKAEQTQTSPTPR